MSDSTSKWFQACPPAEDTSSPGKRERLAELIGCQVTEICDNARRIRDRKPPEPKYFQTLLDQVEIGRIKAQSEACHEPPRLTDPFPAGPGVSAAAADPGEAVKSGESKTEPVSPPTTSPETFSAPALHELFPPTVDESSPEPELAPTREPETEPETETASATPQSSGPKLETESNEPATLKELPASPNDESEPNCTDGAAAKVQGAGDQPRSRHEPCGPASTAPSSAPLSGE